MENEKENNKVHIKPFIILFLISIIIFAIVYFLHSKNIENRFNRTLQNYEKSMSAIFNNMIITNGNNENIYTNSFQTNNEIRFNNKIENLKLSFEVGFKMLESSINEIMKNSNDILQFWFAFLSVIMIVFTLIGFFLNNNILNQTTKQLEIVKIKSKDYINKIKRNAKTENNELIKNIKSKSEEETNKLIQKLESEYNQTIEKFKEENNELIENIKIKTNEETEKLIKELEDKYNEAIKDINKRGKEEGRKIEEESDKKIQENELFNFGLQSVNIKDYKSAIYYFTEVIKLNPKNSMAYNNRCNAKSDLSNTKEKNSEEYNKLINEAIEDYNKAIELNPNYAEAYNNRGNAKNKLQKIGEAIEDYNKAIELNPNYAEAYNNRGNAKNKLQKIGEAIEDYNEAIRLNPNYSTAFYNRGLAKLQLVKIEEAIKDFIKAYELSNNNNEIKESSKNQLISLAKQGYEEAIEFCEENDIDYKN
ncbi:tetratricopeptide repeat protein [uncultured Brachyspira sp.]|uniref:tetratricopeptide repeat protein n=1 Tax=uncultured Brachyspira sp. TaxID=221953 RepID=UPI002585426C|nr:tetratricopeptide repeat protein [uncultured Brachyspira sp.]